MSGPRILVTGASGFVGRSLVPALAARFAVRAASRRPVERARGVENIRSPELGPEADWSAALRDIDVVVHLAAIAHVPRGDAAASARRLETVNVAGTAALAAQAAAGGSRQFVLLSSIKAMGDHSADLPLTPAMTPAPEDAYGRAKLAAERELQRICGQGPMGGVVLRPPMIYGPEPKGNLALLAGLVGRGWPLPFGSIRNHRSLVSLWHLNAIVGAVIDRCVGGETLHVCDPQPLSTPALIQAIAAGLGRRARLVNVPPGLLRRGLALVGRRDLALRLLGSLEMDGTRTWSMLGLTPQHTTAAGIERAMRASMARPAA